MTLRYWAKILSIAGGIAALLGAAQFGVLHGVGMLRLDREFFAGTGNHWNIQLTWIAWIALVATIGGASFAFSLVKRDGQRSGVLVRLGISITAAAGTALTVIPLTAPSARFAKLDVTFDPALTAALAGVVAVLAGLLVALLTIDNPPLSTNLWWTVAAVWVVAVPSFLDTIQYSASYNPQAGYLDPIRLGVLDLGNLNYEARARLSLGILSLILGLAVAFAARMNGRSRIQVALSGAVGPTLVGLAYLIGGPGVTRDHTYQADAYLGALSAVVVGLLASIAVAFISKGRAKATPEV